MKKIIIITLLLIAANGCCYSQIDSLSINDNFKTDSIKYRINIIKNYDSIFILDRAYYQKKSISFKRTGNTFLIVGTSLMLGGSVIALDKNIDLGKAVVALGMMAIGSLIDIISIPFFISSNHNAKLAKAFP